MQGQTTGEAPAKRLTRTPYADDRMSALAAGCLCGGLSPVPGSVVRQGENQLAHKLYLAQNGSPNQVAGHRDTASWAGFDGEVFTEAGLRADLDRNQ